MRPLTLTFPWKKQETELSNASSSLEYAKLHLVAAAVVLLLFFCFEIRSHYCDLRLVYVSYLCVIHTFLFCFQDRGFSVSLAAPGSVDQTDFALCLLSSRIKDVHHRTRPLAPTKA